MNKYLIAAGSSHHQACNYLAQAENYLSNSKNIKLITKSRIFKNASKFSHINRLFFNTVYAVTSNLEPLVFYRELKTIETKLGRIRSYKNAPRTLDLDVLIALNLKYKKSTFFVPHPQAYMRSFFAVCAVEALMNAGWPIDLALSRASRRFSHDYLVAL